MKRIWETIDRWGPGVIAALTLVAVVALGWQYGERISRIEMDPRLNCAANICCPPKEARAMRMQLLCEAGCPESLAEGVINKLDSMGITFAPVQLMSVISELANHPGRT